jgi:transcriptional regulator with XRE-family HTH domain
MGKEVRPKPDRLAEKLLQIRISLGLSQNQLIRHLGFTDSLFQASISGYELGTREPPLPILLRYAEIAGVCTDTLINDSLNLPSKIPSNPRHRGM